MVKGKVRFGVKGVAVLFFVAGMVAGLGLYRLALADSRAFPVQGSAFAVLPSVAGAKAVEYLNGNLLQGQGVTAELKGVNESGSLYLVRLDIKKGGSVVQSAEVYATPDGKNLILGNVIDITKPAAAPKSEPPKEIEKADVPEVKMFVMSFCPFGKQAENGLGPAARMLGLDVEPHFVLYSNYRGGGPDFCIESGKYCSMHGIAELNEDIRQLCVYRDFKDKWWAYVDYVNSKCSLQNVESCWKDAASSAGIDASAVESCQKSDGASLAKAEFELGQEYGVEGSPTVFINGGLYQGGRSPEDFKTAICGAYKSPPASCGNELESSEQATTASCG